MRIDRSINQINGMESKGEKEREGGERDRHRERKRETEGETEREEYNRDNRVLH